jgi:hypothetical protein
MCHRASMTDEPEPYNYALGTLGEPPSINLLIEITAAEYEEIDEAASAIAWLNTPFDYNLVERNFLDLASIPLH